MIQTWVLVLIFTNNFDGGVSASSTIDGFSSKATCEQAAAQIPAKRKICVEKK